MSDESSVIVPAAEDATGAVSLDAFTRSVGRADGVELKGLTPLDTIEVHTRNSVYRIHLIDPRTGDAVVSGGAYFPVNTRVTISGATFGGSMLRCGVVLVGCLLEIAADGYRVTTTRVREIAVNPASTASTPLGQN